MSESSPRCYWPNGQEVTQYNYQPCNHGADPDHAACCDLRTSVCTENGYCIGNANYIYRGGCTDSTWASSSCAQKCSFAVEADLTNFANIFDCGGGAAAATNDQEWCCGKTDGSSCCDDKFSVAFGRPYFPTNTTTVTNTTTTAITATTTVTISHSDTGTSVSDSSESSSPIPNSSGTDMRAVGIGVGVGAGISVLILVLTVFYIMKERKRRLGAEQRLNAVIAQDHGSRDEDVQPRLEMEQPNHTAAKGVYQKVHEIKTSSLYEVQG